jgi:hypothetical protein
VGTGNQQLEIGESLIGAGMVLADFLEVTRRRLVYAQVSRVRGTTF